ncbi:hypothetical protein [Burkholderia ubonensis]|uniref:hypothetical protein n=1 Tax=Burkholderia ubonensis TaxID=101571 RepID=UPI002ABD895C|nr:hypothetical protein [Burkholderia ubonensis]
MEYELVVSHGLLWKGSAGARHAVTDRQEEEGDDRIIDATGHAMNTWCKRRTTGADRERCAQRAEAEKQKTRSKAGFSFLEDLPNFGISSSKTCNTNR